MIANVIIFVLFLAIAHLELELHQRSVHLRWVDDRDHEIARLWESAWNLTLIPKGNPLNLFKQHGMLSKDAFMRATELMPMLDERLDALDGALTGLTKQAKALRLWEQQNPPPPLHYWQVRTSKTETGRLSERPHSEQRMPQQEDHHGRADSDDRPGLGQGAVGAVPDDQATL